MIVVAGSPIAVEDDRGISAGGLPVLVARTLAERGKQVELVGRIGSDEMGDALIIALRRANIGHAALLRDSAHATPHAAKGGKAPRAIPIDVGDLQLALRYITAFDAAILVVGDQDAVATEALVRCMEEGAAFAGARLIVVGDRSCEGEREGEAAAATPPGATLYLARGGASDAELAVVLADRLLA